MAFYTFLLQYMLRLPRDATVELLKKAVSELTGVHLRDVRKLFAIVSGIYFFKN